MNRPKTIFLRYKQMFTTKHFHICYRQMMLGAVEKYPAQTALVIFLQILI